MPLLTRLALLTLGMGMVEIGLTEMVGRGLDAASGLELVIGLLLVVGGTAAFIGPLLSTRRGSTDAQVGGPDHD